MLIVWKELWKLFTVWGRDLHVHPSTMWQDKSECTRCHHVYPGYWEFKVQCLPLVDVKKAYVLWPVAVLPCFQMKYNQAWLGMQIHESSNWMDMITVYSINSDTHLVTVVHLSMFFPRGAGGNWCRGSGDLLEFETLVGILTTECRPQGGRVPTHRENLEKVRN